MEYLHASLVLHSAGKKITEKGITDILSAAGIEPDKNKIKGLISTLADVNIDEALKSAATMPTIATTHTAPASHPTTPAPAAAQPKPEEEEEEEETGLSSLFG